MKLNSDELKALEKALSFAAENTIGKTVETYENLLARVKEELESFNTPDPDEYADDHVEDEDL